ncbi:MAG: vitamin B12-dependent ribonucleotide reductase [Clostridia bacterium]|nr:vitamin B12-dependent ribonucleotide reductase [Clostridia bacterium]
MAKIDSIITRHFTKSLENSNKTVYDLFEYKTVDIHMKNWKTGETILDMKQLEFPVNYSLNACKIIASKYFRKSGVDNERGHEYSMIQVADRLVGFWADALLKEGLLDDKAQWQIIYDELVYAFLSQMWAPNSPQWFNTGIMRNYNIPGEKDGLFYYDEMLKKVVQSPDRYTRTQASACFILSIKDQLLGKQSITDHYVSETNLFKGGSGVGTNFSVLRAKNERISNGGYSSGMLSFLQGLDRNAGAIKSGGTTRRAAKMVIVDIDHPDVEEFILWKEKEEQKVRALAKMGYDSSIDGEAYQTVSGQNSNNSVRLNKEFMDKVLNLDNDKDALFQLKGRKDSEVDKEVSVDDLWNKINKAAWECADPGLQFDDTFNAWHTCPAGSDGEYGAKHNRINSTNPCSEYSFLDDTACNLASINVHRFYDDSTDLFDTASYIHLVCFIQMILEASIYWGQFPTEQVALNSYLFRTTGIGMANLASVLLSAGMAYDSKESRAFAGALAGIMTGYSYYTSALMAEKLGAFESYDINSSYMKSVIRNHARVGGYLEDGYENLFYQPVKVNHSLIPQNISDALKSGWKMAIEAGDDFGYRNAQVSVIAPTGTISFAMDCGATSVEPYYSHVVYKELVGGGFMELVNPVLETALSKLGYKKNEIEDIFDYLLQKGENGNLVNHNMHSAPHIKEEHMPIFDAANDISPEGHVLMVSAITPQISGAVSKTVNLPAESTVEDIKSINILAYKTGAKAVAVYRDGCKAAQPLNLGSSEDADKPFEEYTYLELLEYARSTYHRPTRKKPNGVRISRTHAAKIGDIELYITIGFYEDGELSEIFVSTDKEGTVVKGILASLSKAISNMLQYQISPEHISKTLRGQKFEPSGFVSRHPYIKSASSISDLISKVIDIERGDFSRCQVKPERFSKVISEKYEAQEKEEEYYEEPEHEDLGEVVYGERCSSCGSERLIRNGTCKVCRDCGTTTGCS